MKYPKEFMDYGREYPRWHETYYEYPSNPERPFDYGKQTNNQKGDGEPGLWSSFLTSSFLIEILRHSVLRFTQPWFFLKRRRAHLHPL